VSLAALKIPHHALRVFDKMDELDHIINSGFLQGDESEDESETDCNQNEELNELDARSEDYAEVNKLMDHDSHNDGKEADKEEEEVTGLVEMGEDILGQNNQGKDLEEIEKDGEDTRVIITEELPTTAERYETSHTVNNND